MALTLDQYKKAKKLLFEIDPSERETFEENLELLKGPPGPPGVGKDGYTPIKGVDYDDGKDGKTPTKEEILAVVKPLIPAPIKGDKGDPGKDADIKDLLPEVKKIRAELLTIMPKGGGSMPIVDRTITGRNILTYNSDGTLASLSNPAGSKTIVWSGGLVSSVIGTGAYKSRSFTWPSGILSEFNVKN
jgi:hypothetical protein